MKYLNSITNILAVSAVLFVGGLACGGGTDSTTTGNNSSTGHTATETKTSTPKNIAGNYTATGKNPDGAGEYNADLTVTERGDVYQFSWTSGKSSYDGVGVMTDNRVAVSYTDGTNGKGCGVVLYKVGSDGSLDGKVGYWGNNSRETEKATRKSGSGSEIEGEYDIVGKNPEGKEYKGTLKVAKSGDGYTFDWTAGNSFSGFGIRDGNSVAVGFGGKQCAFVGYDVGSDGTLDGKWGNQVAKTFGTEVAKKK